MSIRILTTAFLTSFILISCSTINKKDCTKDMMALGLSQGRAGSSKIYTDDLRNVCMSKNPTINLADYEKGFYQGWMEYCLPVRAFEMGKRGDRYFSFCPTEREALFREKYLVGKSHFELKDVEEELVEKMENLKPSTNESSADFDEYNALKNELEKTRRDIHALEVEGARDSFKFR